MRCYKRPRTHNEMVANCRDEGYVRGRRSVANLADPWDDVCRHIEGSWKWQTKNRCQFGGSRETFKARSCEYEPEEEEENANASVQVSVLPWVCTSCTDRY